MDAVNSLPVGGLLSNPAMPSSDGPREKVAADFESLFVSHLLKEMRNTLEDGLFAGEGSDTYGGLFDLYLSRHLSENGGMGLKQAILNSFGSSGFDTDSTGMVENS